MLGDEADHDQDAEGVEEDLAGRACRAPLEAVLHQQAVNQGAVEPVLSPGEVDGLDRDVGPSACPSCTGEEVVQPPWPLHTGMSQEHGHKDAVDDNDSGVLIGQTVPGPFPLVALPGRNKVVSVHHPPRVRGVDAPQLKHQKTNRLGHGAEEGAAHPSADTKGDVALAQVPERICRIGNGRMGFTQQNLCRGLAQCDEAGKEADPKAEGP
mmetsp:Transcript_11612/g.22071  ORF Transcript_11612/g.22071 Transcript_11612/m.22071 type:complete len:210 (-) Transcript_11612:119-748(-)